MSSSSLSHWYVTVRFSSHTKRSTSSSSAAFAIAGQAVALTERQDVRLGPAVGGVVRRGLASRQGRGRGSGEEAKLGVGDCSESAAGCANFLAAPIAAFSRASLHHLQHHALLALR